MAQNNLYQSDYRIYWSSISLEGINQYLRFLHRVSHQRKVPSGHTTFGWVWPVVVPLLQLDFRIPLSSNLWTESIEILVFFACRLSSKAVNILDYHFYWVWPGTPLVQSDCRILCSLVSLEGINWYQNVFTLCLFLTVPHTQHPQSPKKKMFFLNSKHELWKNFEKIMKKFWN